MERFPYSIELTGLTLFCISFFVNNKKLDHRVKVIKTHPQAYGNLGICLAKQGKKEAAIEAFDKALEIDPNYELATLNKMRTENLKEGEKLGGSLKMTDYYKEHTMKNRSIVDRDKPE